MIVTLVSQKKIYGLHLPEKCSGKYWIHDNEKSFAYGDILAIEADEKNQLWKLKKIKNKVSFFDGNGETNENEKVLKEGMICALGLGKNYKEKAFLLVEPFSKDRCSFSIYKIVRDVDVNIGREKDNDIVINNPFVSAYHAQLCIHGKDISIKDNEKTNGLYVNSERVTGSKLKPGDMIYILGFKIIIGYDYIAINNPEGAVHINCDVLEKYETDEKIDTETLELGAQPFFYRAPRFREKIEPLLMKVDMPTRPGNDDDTPLIVSVLPSLLMGVASFSSGIITTVNAFQNSHNIRSSIPTLIMSVSMLIGMVIFPFIIKARDKRKKKQKEIERREKYLKYINNLREEISGEISKQEKLLRNNSPFILEQIEDDEFWKRGLWGKTKEHEDFLFTRIGLGDSPIEARIDFPEERFSIDDDVMRRELFKFKDEERLLKQIPIGISLREERVVGIVGNKEDKQNVLSNILMQIYAMHSYDEVKTVVICEKKDVANYEYVKWVPHSWNNEGKIRYFASTEDDLRELSNNLRKIVQESKENTKLPHYVIVSLSVSLTNKASFVSEILEHREIENFSVIVACDEINNLPKECDAVIELSGNTGFIYRKSNVENGKTSFKMDSLNIKQVEKNARKIAGYQLDLNHGKYDLPGILPFMNMYGVGKCEYLNIPKRWKDNNPVLSLRAPVGLDTNGDIFYLDLHEKFHGPHGLIAGMTGSGKSEFIISYILSMAINYHPDEVAFVLIDYKGGGLTGAFENEKYRLPHLAGTITNLDGGAITRSILSIKSELRRRQTMFNKARTIANEGTMDIYKYQKMYRDGMVSEPLPHLIIVSDEFAELKAQKPEFMEQLISTARIGRSLGVHLVLATQKPSGVVNDQIWANSKFKVCLKVQDKADSMEMLKRPDAAEITETGRFYLQVGYNEIFEMGQSAWSGALYPDSEELIVSKDNSIDVLDDLGNVIEKIKEKKIGGGEKNDNGKQIVKIMEYLSVLSTEENISERQLWLPEISPDIMQDYLVDKYQYQVVDKFEIKALIGELDDPYRQNQELLEVNFSQVGNIIVYGSTGSGKEMYIYAMLCSLFQNYTAEQINAYILDFGAETLKMYEKAPQCGGVIFDGEDDRIASTFNIVSNEIKKRKKLFAEFGGDFVKYNTQNEKTVPAIMVIINNYAHFVDSYERYEDILLTITRECPKYGIFFTITANTANAIRFRLTQNFGQNFILKLNDKNDYLSLIGSTGGVLPNKNKGSGIIKKDEVYSFQIANVVGKGEDINEYVSNLCDFLSQERSIGKAPKIPTLPKFMTASEYKSNGENLSKIPIGMSQSDYEITSLDFCENNILQILAEDSFDAMRVVAGIIETTADIRNIETIMFHPSRGIEEYISSECEFVLENIETRIQQIFDLCVHRNNSYKLKEDDVNDDKHPILCIFNDYGLYKNGLSEECYDSIVAMLSKVEGFCNVAFIIVDSYSNSRNYSSELWNIERCGGEGLWIGNGVADQIKFQIHKKTNEMTQTVEDNVGFLVNKGNAKTLRMIWPDKCVEEVKDE